MTKTYEEQRNAMEQAKNDASEAKARASHTADRYTMAVAHEQGFFDAMLKDPDFQRWLRETWETCRTSFRQQREAQLEREKATEWPSQQAHCIHGFLHSCPDCHRPQPTARAHLKGCVLDATHEEGCYVPIHVAVEFMDAATELPTERCDGIANPEEVAQGKPARLTQSPTLSPRQALGEALACVERASSILFGTDGPAPFGVDVAREQLHAAIRHIRRSYEAAT